VRDAALSSAGARFEADYAMLEEGSPALGQIARLPWDTEIFGFPVADYRAGDPRDLTAGAQKLAERLDLWTRREGVDLVGTRVPAHPALLGALLESVGFRFVEMQLRATLPRLRSSDLRPSRITIRAASAADREGIARIAGSAFTLGRYHADPRFPRPLADRRYRVWMERSLADPSPGTWIGVVGPESVPSGFLHAELTDRFADIRLAAVDQETAGIAGPELFLGALHEFARRGVTQATARVSAVNSAVLNIYAALGFRFHEPELVFHWHRPGASSLLSPARWLENSR
jgi:hypothetical protein